SQRFTLTLNSIVKNHTTGCLYAKYPYSQQHHDTTRYKSRQNRNRNNTCTNALRLDELLLDIRNKVDFDHYLFLLMPRPIATANSVEIVANCCCSACGTRTFCQGFA